MTPPGVALLILVLLVSQRADCGRVNCAGSQACAEKSQLNIISTDGRESQPDDLFNKYTSTESGEDSIVISPSRSVNDGSLERTTQEEEARFWIPRSQPAISVQAISRNGLRKFRDYPTMSVLKKNDRNLIRTRRSSSQISPIDEELRKYSKQFNSFPNAWKTSLSGDSRKELEKEIASEIMSEKNNKSLRNIMLDYFSRVNEPRFIQSEQLYNSASNALSSLSPSGVDFEPGSFDDRLVKKGDWDDIDMQVWG